MSFPRRYLLSTAALPASLIDEAAAKGMQLDIVPFILTEAVESTGQMAAEPRNVVFTSQNAVEAVKDISPTNDWRIYCTGGATRRLAAEKFGEEAIAGTADSARKLATVIIRALPESSRGGRKREVRFFCGDQRREELPAMLRQAGFQVEEVVVYRTVLTPHKIERAYNGIAFFSPSAVESYFSMNADNVATALFAIGRTTAAAILVRTGREAIVSSRQDKEILIQQMIAHFTL
jgi:uroporphyrinogen-III synthase